MGTSTRGTMVSGLPYYVWEVPDKPISIQLPFDVIDRMSPDILRGFGALKRRGAEVGGILFGRWETEPRMRVLVEDFEPVPSEYLTGPSYNLSPNDLAAFEAALARRTGPDSRMAPIGFYRSHTRDELFLDDADLALASKYFPGPENVFLLIKPFASRPCIGGFFFWEDGEIYRESSYLQFPFQRKELGGGDMPRPAPAPSYSESNTLPPLPPYTPAAERQELVPIVPGEQLRQVARRQNLSILDVQEARPSTRPRLRLMAVPLFFAVAAVAGFVAYRGLDRPKPAVRAVSVDTALPLKLSVAEKQSQLEVTWDRNSPSIARAKRGVLSILDGTNRRELDLTGAQLRNGRVLYSRLSGDVSLRLEVFSEGQSSVNESIRIVSTEGFKPADSPPPARAAKEPAPRKNIASSEKAAARPVPRLPSHRAAAAQHATETAVTKTPASPPPAIATPAAPAEVELERPKIRR